MNNPKKSKRPLTAVSALQTTSAESKSLSYTNLNSVLHTQQSSANTNSIFTPYVKHGKNNTAYTGGTGGTGVTVLPTPSQSERDLFEKKTFSNDSKILSYNIVIKNLSKTEFYSLREKQHAPALSNVDAIVMDHDPENEEQYFKYCTKYKLNTKLMNPTARPLKQISI